MYTHILCFEQNKKSKQNLQKIFSFYNFGKISILHGHVFVMTIKKQH